MLGITVIGALSLLCGLLLGIASWLFRVEGGAKLVQVEDLLPGMQCGQCGFAGCSQAAEALAAGQVDVSICPPGGRLLIEQLAQELNLPMPEEGGGESVSMVAYIDEALCIGCTKCEKACPTDAIVGASRQIHVVLAEYCTACGKCVDICPTETVRLDYVRADIKTWQWPAPSLR